MRAVLLDRVTKAEDTVLTEVKIPQVRPGWVLVKVRGFGLNHSEQILRQSEIEADYIRKPIIPGIECTGEVADPSDSGLAIGQKVVALMGGMGRNFHGSYAEYALLPRHIVFPVQTALPWADLAAVPETYYTAWGSLFDCLHLRPEDTLLVRGGTCGLGYAAIQLAKALGCRVLATTHRESKFSLLQQAGADETLLDAGALAEAARGKGITKVLELVGARSLRDSLQCVVRGGIVCHTGVLGNVFHLQQFDPIKDIPNGVYLTGFFSNYPDQQTIDAIMAFMGAHDLKPRRGAVYRFADIRQALMDMDGHKVDGKIVVTMD